jgi:hypothetical protein
LVVRPAALGRGREAPSCQVSSALDVADLGDRIEHQHTEVGRSRSPLEFGSAQRSLSSVPITSPASSRLRPKLVYVSSRSRPPRTRRCRPRPSPAPGRPRRSRATPGGWWTGPQPRCPRSPCGEAVGRRHVLVARAGAEADAELHLADQDAVPHQRVAAEQRVRVEVAVAGALDGVLLEGAQVVARGDSVTSVSHCSGSTNRTPLMGSSPAAGSPGIWMGAILIVISSHSAASSSMCDRRSSRWWPRSPVAGRPG